MKLHVIVVGLNVYPVITVMLGMVYAILILLVQIKWDSVLYQKCVLVEAQLAVLIRYAQGLTAIVRILRRVITIKVNQPSPEQIVYVMMEEAKKKFVLLGNGVQL